MLSLTTSVNSPDGKSHTQFNNSKNDPGPKLPRSMSRPTLQSTCQDLESIDALNNRAANSLRNNEVSKIVSHNNTKHKRKIEDKTPEETQPPRKRPRTTDQPVPLPWFYNTLEFAVDYTYVAWDLKQDPRHFFPSSFPPLEAKFDIVGELFQCATFADVPDEILMVALLFLHRYRVYGSTPPSEHFYSKAQWFGVAYRLAHRLHGDKAVGRMVSPGLHRFTNMAALELRFMEGLDWKLDIQEEEWMQWVRYVELLHFAYSRCT